MGLKVSDLRFLHSWFLNMIRRVLAQVAPPNSVGQHTLENDQRIVDCLRARFTLFYLCRNIRLYAACTDRLKVVTVDDYFGEPHKIKTIHTIWIFAEEPGSAILEVSVDGGDFESVGGASEKVTRHTREFSGNYFKFKIRHTETNSPQIDAIVVDYSEDGEK